MESLEYRSGFFEWNLEGSFGVELTGAIFFPGQLPGLGVISNFILKQS